MVRNEYMKIGMREFSQWLLRLFRQPVFIFVTIWGHASILCGALGFQHFEAATNPKVGSFFEAYYWAVSMATSVGSADIAPVTTGGKVVAILLMCAGALFLWSYAALFAASAFVPAVREFGREMHDLEAGVQEIEKDVRLDRLTVEKLLRELEKFNQSQEGKHEGHRF